jgi:hypothetical protein
MSPLQRFKLWRYRRRSVTRQPLGFQIVPHDESHFVVMLALTDRRVGCIFTRQQAVALCGAIMDTVAPEHDAVVH